MKLLTFKFSCRLVLVLSILLIPGSAQASYGWGGGDGQDSRRDSTGFSNQAPSSGYGHPMTTAEISQTLYGSYEEPYDTAAGEDPQEVIKAG